MVDTPYAQQHPTKHGLGEGAKSVFHEVPTWGWWVMGISGIVVVYIRARRASSGGTATMAGAATTAADVQSGGSSAGTDYSGLNNLMVQSEQLTTAQFLLLEQQIAALSPIPGATGPAGGSGPTGATGATGASGPPWHPVPMPPIPANPPPIGPGNVAGNPWTTPFGYVGPLPPAIQPGGAIPPQTGVAGDKQLTTHPPQTS